MGLARSMYVKDGEEGVYHCFARCVRRAFLCGFDPQTGLDYSHRKQWIVDRLKFLATVFAIDVCAFAVLWNHFHAILRTRPDLAALWSDREIAIRWLTLFPKRRNKKEPVAEPTEEQISALTACPERIAILRKRLSSLSWFMGSLNEFIARAANKEDKVKGRFWESRFKCQALLDEAAIASCMVYVDLNPIRAGLASCPEESGFTSIQERIRDWQRENMAKGFISSVSSENIQAGSLGENRKQAENAGETLDTIHPGVRPTTDSLSKPSSSAGWLCPIQSDSHGRGILGMTEQEYFDLVDRSGRMVRSDKRGSIDSGLAPILLRIGANSEEWLDTISRFGSKFCLAAGTLPNLRGFAQQIGRRWLKGIASAHAAFAPSKP